MRTIPVDAARLGNLQVLTTAPRLDDEGKQQTTNPDFGPLRPKWNVQCLRTPPDRADGTKPKAELVDITLTSELDVTEIPPMTSVVFPDLVARSWTMGNRSGIAFSATEVQVTT